MEGGKVSKQVRRWERSGLMKLCIDRELSGEGQLSRGS